MTKIWYSADFKIAEYLDRIRANLRPRLEGVVEQLGREIEAVARAKAPHRSGRLAGSLSHKVRSTRTRVMGIVSAYAPHAHFIESGFHGTERVAESYRMIKQAFGRPIKPVQVLVKAHPRKVDVAGTPFLRDALEAGRMRITERLRWAIDRAVE